MMNTTTKATLVLCAGILGVSLGLIVSRCLERPTPAPLRFAATPAFSSGFVTFQITNQGRRVIGYTTLPVQVKSNGRWLDLQGVSPATRSTLVPPKQTITFTTVAPSNKLPWRVPVSWSYMPTKFQIWRWRAGNLLPRQSRSLAMESQVAYSPVYIGTSRSELLNTDH
jgi:hypothetical protein